MKNKVLIFLAIIAVVAILWWIGIIPKMIGEHTAKKYVEENYEDMYLTFDNIEYSKEHGDYIARFVNKKNNNIYNFKLSPNYFPTTVVYDSIKEPNV